MHFLYFIPVLFIGATFLVALDKIIGVTYRGSIQQLIHVVAYSAWGGILYAAVFH